MVGVASKDVGVGMVGADIDVGNMVIVVGGIGRAVCVWVWVV